jgi:hypothetical protein
MDSSQPPRHVADPNSCLPDFFYQWASTDSARLKTKHQVLEASKAGSWHQLWDTPAYTTRQKDWVFYPSPKTFTDA